MTDDLKSKLIIQPKVVMNSFCYAYTKALVEKLESMIERNWELFDTPDNTIRDEQSYGYTIIGRAVIEQIVFQLFNTNLIDVGAASSSATKKDVRTLLSSAKEFLAIFEAK